MNNFNSSDLQYVLVIDNKLIFQYLFGVRIVMFNATFNKISVISGQSVLLVEETKVPGENHRPVASHWQTWSHNVVSSTPRQFSSKFLYQSWKVGGHVFCLCIRGIAPPLSVEMPVPSQESDRSCICVLWCIFTSFYDFVIGFHSRTNNVGFFHFNFITFLY